LVKIGFLIDFFRSFLLRLFALAFLLGAISGCSFVSFAPLRSAKGYHCHPG